MSPGLHQAGLLPSATEMAFANRRTAGGQFGGVMILNPLWSTTSIIARNEKVVKHYFRFIFPSSCATLPVLGAFGGHNSVPLQEVCSWGSSLNMDAPPGIRTQGMMP